MNWLFLNNFSSKGSRRTNNLIDSNLAYVCAYYFTSTNQSNQIQEVKLAPMQLLDVWSFGLCSDRRVSFLSQGWANVSETLCSLNRPCFTGSWAGRHCPLKAALQSPTLVLRVSFKCPGFQYLRGKGQMLFWYQHALYRSIMTGGNPMSCRLPHELFLLILASICLSARAGTICL